MMIDMIKCILNFKDMQMTKTKVSNLDFSEVFIRNFFSAAAVNHMSCKEVVLYYAKINSIIQMHAKKCVVMRLQDFLFCRTSFNIGRHTNGSKKFGNSFCH